MKRAMILFVCMLFLIPLFLMSASTPAYADGTHYNPYKAAAWACDSNHVNNTTGACATFVRRCLIAGGFSGINFIDNTKELRSFVLNNGYGTEYAVNNSNLSIISIGDIVEVYAGSTIKHVIIVTGVGSDCIWYSARNNNHCDEKMLFSKLKSYHNSWSGGTATKFLHMNNTAVNSPEPAASIVYNNHAYERYDYHLSWTDAKAFCEQQGGYLVTITDAEEQSAVLSLLTEDPPLGFYHIGATDPNQSGSWTWVNGDPFSYSNWDPQQPEPTRADGEFYAAIIAYTYPPNKQRGEWIDEPNITDNTRSYYATANSGFICEYPAVIHDPAWSFDSSTGTLTISCIGEMENYGGIQPWASLRDEITTAVIRDGVTSIGRCAFESCTHLTSVTIPDSVTGIGAYAFYDCANLTGITIPDSVTSIGHSAFSGCSGLTAVTIPNGVTSIGANTFYNCCALATVSIPATVTSIGDAAFMECCSLTSVTVPDCVTSIGEYAFCDCSGLTDITIPNSVCSIGEAAFSQCYSLTGIDIPDGMTFIADDAFSDCSSLAAITVPDSVEYIGDRAFCQCYSLTGFVIPDAVETIGEGAFSYCTGLTGITIPAAVTEIGDSAFRGCSDLISITVEKDNLSYASLDGMLYDKSISEILYCPGGKTGSVVIPNSVTSIAARAFQGCNGLTGITIPNGVVSIGESAFSSCSGLTVLTIPNSVTSIGETAFFACSNLTGVRIPDSVTSIDVGTFYMCRKLTEISIPDSVTSIGMRAFHYCTSLTDVYFGGTLEQWTAIEIGSYNDVLSTATLHYDYTIPWLRPDFVLPASLTSIEDEAFRGGAFTYAQLSDRTVSIGALAFADCPNLSYIYIPASTTDIHENAFDGIQDLTIFGVPESDAERFAQEKGFAFIPLS